ncbi:rhodanese-like domain-containing protein [Sulfobacillus harzensis]|uniref:Sulfurtransferase n=1 Tax=Sulfobacillus harzensis TaxID=2729629 RepID=A0A7Y0L265_9FIRM|nr:rhodanese-like domain-containing protein [Sulfobacillus harzensis]NMP21929.1 sulfurtransferase [Sulfobacillus harzensis]
MTAEELKNWSEQPNNVVIDVRQGRAYTEGHIPGALSAPYRQQGWSRPVSAWVKQQGAGLGVGLFADNAVIAKAAKDALEAEGVTVSAIFDGGIAAWSDAGYRVVAVKALTVDELASHLNDWTIIDVREPYELRSGTIPGALSIPMGNLENQVKELSPDRRYAIVCASGNRSQSAAAYLAEQGFDVANVVGGMSLWLGGGHPVER